MINGFQVHVTADELRTHLTARVEHHTARAAKRSAELPKLVENYRAVYVSQFGGGGAPQPGASYGNSYMGIQKKPEDYEAEQVAAIEVHTNAAKRFRFYAAHIPSTETYQLQTHDLASLELL